MSYLGFYIDTTKICMFSKSTCTYCNKANELLKTYNYDPQIYELDNLREGMFIGQQLKQLTGQTKVPNIFIDGRHIGGYTELYNMHVSGELKNIIRSKQHVLTYTCIKCGVNSDTKILPCNCLQYQYDDWGRPI